MSGLSYGVSPREVIPGDPDELRWLAARLSSLADELADTAGRLGAVETGSWKGTAASAFQGVMTEQPRGYMTAADIFGAAGRAISAYASALEAAQSAAATAVTTYEDAEATSAAWRQRRASALGLTEAEDPGDEGRSRATGALSVAREEVDAAAARVISTLSAGAAAAPSSGSLFDTLFDALRGEVRRHHADFATLVVLARIAQKSNSAWSRTKWAAKWYSTVSSWRRAAGGAAEGSAQLSLVDEAESLAQAAYPTLNNSKIAAKVASALKEAPGTGRIGTFLGDASRATPWFARAGFATGVVGLGVGLYDIHRDWHKGTDQLGIDSGNTLMAAGGAAMLVFPPAAVPLIVAGTVIWSASELIKDDRYKWVGHETASAATWYWDHTAPGVLWHNHAAIGHALDHGVDVAGSAASDVGHEASHVWHKVF